MEQIQWHCTQAGGPQRLSQEVTAPRHSHWSGASKSEPGPLPPSLGCILLCRKQHGDLRQAQVLKPEDQAQAASLERAS